MFVFDEELFKKAASEIYKTKDEIDDMKDLTITIKGIPVDADIQSEVDDVISKINNVSTKLDELCGKTKLLEALINGSFDTINKDDLLNMNMDLSIILMILSQYDPQVNNSGKFQNFTDYQNIMLSFLSLLSLFYGEEANGKTIKELFDEIAAGKNYSLQDFLNFSFDSEMIASLDDEQKREEYKALYLGKLLLYGFGNITVEESVKGDNGFDALVLRDKNDEILIYFPGTDINDPNDIEYDAYPLAPGVVNSTVFNSQQEQAVNIVKKYLNNGEKVHVGGFSLGGSLAEHAYNKCFKDEATRENMGDLILYNPYHTEIDNTVMDNLTNPNSGRQIKLYAYEGDIVSKACKFEGCERYYENTKVIPMDVGNTKVSEGLKTANSPDSIFIKQTNKFTKLGLSNNNLEALNSGLDMLADYIPGIEKGTKVQDLEVAFSRLHMPNVIELNKESAFDENGQVKTNNTSTTNYNLYGMEHVLRVIGDQTHLSN